MTNAVLAGRFHADLKTVVFAKSFNQFFKPFGKEEKQALLILSKTVGIGNAMQEKSWFLEIKPTAVLAKDFE